MNKYQKKFSVRVKSIMKKTCSTIKHAKLIAGLEKSLVEKFNGDDYIQGLRKLEKERSVENE